MTNGFADYKEFFERIGREKTGLEEKVRVMEEMLEGKKNELAKVTALVNTLRGENEKLRHESETLIKRTEDRLKIGQNALDSVDALEAEVFELKVKLTEAHTELETLRKSTEKAASVNYEMSLEVERLKASTNELTTEAEYGKKLCEESSEIRRRLRSLKEYV